MINKIKDFLKNRLRKRSGDFNDQVEEVYVNNEEEAENLIDPPTSTDKTSSFKINAGSLKDRFTGSISNLRDKLPSKDTKLGRGKKRAEKTQTHAPGLERFLGQNYREPIHQGFLVILICSIVYTLGKVTALALKGSPQLDTAKSFSISIPLEKDFNPQLLGQVKSSNPFKTNAAGGGTKKKIADTKCEQAQGASGLPIKLVNTIVLQDIIKSLASVQVRGERILTEVRVGDQISNLAKIFKITRLELLVKNLESGACESIVSEKAFDKKSPISVLSPAASRDYKKNLKMPGIENVGNKFKISKTLLDEKMKDMASVLSQARAIKIQNPDGTMSFKLTEMDPQGIFPYLGLQDQDIITSINGKPIYDMNEIMGLFGRIKNLDNLSLGIKREGSDSTQEYSIKK